jgi:hypothetical protein
MSTSAEHGKQSGWAPDALTGTNSKSTNLRKTAAALTGFMSSSLSVNVIPPYLQTREA